MNESCRTFSSESTADRWPTMVILILLVICSSASISVGTVAQVHNYLIPGIAHLPGSLSTQWRSSVAVVNPCNEATEVEFTFWPSEYGESPVTVTRTLNTGASEEWQDVLVELFELPTTAITKGIIQVASNLPLAITTRTYNQTSSGSFGQYLPALTREMALTPKRFGIIPQLKHTASFRSNIGVLNLSSDRCAIVLALANNNGQQVGDEVTFSLEPKQYWQGDNIFGPNLTGAGNQTTAYATIRRIPETCLIWAFASVIDNSSGDPTTIPVLEGRSTAYSEPTVISNQALTSVEQGGYHPRWSPDGHTIAFTAQRNNEPQLFTIPAEGGQEYHVETGLSGDHALTWLPDGEHISFDAYVPSTGRLAIWKVNINSGAVSRLTSGSAPSVEPAWSRDGSRFAYFLGGTGADIWSEAADGGDRQRHTSHPAFDWRPHWSSDGIRLLFTSERSGNADIWAVDITSGELAQITTHPAFDSRAVWSPDDRWIAFTSERSGERNIWIVSTENSSSSVPVRLTTDSEGGGVMPDWSPEGDQLAYVANGRIRVMTLAFP